MAGTIKDLSKPDKEVKIPKKTSLEEKQILPENDIVTPKEVVIDVDKSNLIPSKYLTPEKKKKLEDRFYSEIKETIDNESGLRQDLVEKHEIYEQLPPSAAKGQTDHSFDMDDGPSPRAHYGTVSVQGKVARYMSSMFSMLPICTFKLIDQKKKDVERRLENWFNFRLDKHVKVKNRYREEFKNVGIEDTGMVSITWDKRTEPEKGVETYTSIEQFTKDFPSTKEAGIPQDEYDLYIQALTPKVVTPIMPGGVTGNTGGFEPPVSGSIPGPAVIPQQPQSISIDIPIKKNKVVYNFARMDVVNRSKFGLIPAQSTFEQSRGKFIEFEHTWNDLAKGFSESRYTDIERIKERYMSGYDPNTEEVNEAQAQIEKKTDSNNEKDYTKEKYKMHRILYSIDIDGDGLEELCIFTFAYNQKVLVRAEYWDRSWYLIPHYVEKKPNRFEGIGIIQKCKSIILEAEEMIRYRLKAAKLATSPAFKAKKSSSFDPGAQYWYPGVIWWLEDMDEIEQFIVNCNFPELFQEEAQLERKYEMLTGATSGMSGRELPQDPTAPGNKTAMLLQQGSVLINEDIDTLREGVEATLYAILQMAEKYLPEDDIYLQKFGLTKEDLKVNIDELSLYGTTVSHNIEQRRIEEMQFFSAFAMNPLIGQNPQALTEMTRDAIRVWNKDPEKFVWSDEKLAEYQVKIQMEAMKRVEAEKARQMEEGNFIKMLQEEGVPEAKIKTLLEQFKMFDQSQAAKGGQGGDETGQEAPQLPAGQPNQAQSVSQA